MTRFVAATAVFLLLTLTPASARPAGCPSLWCACYMCVKHGISVQECKKLGLWAARTWAKLFPTVPLAPGTVAVFTRGKRGGHVGDVVAVKPGMVLLHSGNDSNQIKTRWRSTRGLITAVNPHGYASAAPKKIKIVVKSHYRKKVRHAHKRERAAPPAFIVAHAAS